MAHQPAHGIVLLPPAVNSGILVEPQGVALGLDANARVRPLRVPARATRNGALFREVGIDVDYGHALEFGSFITPSAANPVAPVALAQVSEASGLDLVTFQDHPYQPAFLDTWTLMTFVAARTDRIRIAPNVLNVPLRPPAVVARSAASLDLLSNGRFDLALGAGGFWDAIEAMGGRRLTPGEAVTALEEAIDVIRELWDTERAPWRIHRRPIPPACTVPNADRARLTTSRSGSAPTSRACSPSPDGRATDGCPRTPT